MEPGGRRNTGQNTVAALITWCVAGLLSLLYAACSAGRFSLDTLRLPGVVLVALPIGTGITIPVILLFVWAFRPGVRNGPRYGLAP